jgi:preprotein translocase subunit YajC
MLISPAYAQAAPAAGGGDLFVSLLPLVLIFVVFYFLLIRPQQQKLKQHRQMIAELKKGDQILTGGGILGKITRVEADNTLLVEIAPNVVVKVERGTVSAQINKAGQAAANDGGAAARTSGGGAKAAAGGTARAPAGGGLFGRLFKK